MPSKSFLFLVILMDRAWTGLHAGFKLRDFVEVLSVGIEGRTVSCLVVFLGVRGAKTRRCYVVNPGCAYRL